MFEGGAEAEVGYHNYDPSDEARDCRYIDKPVENGGAGVGDVEIGEEREGPCKKNGYIRNAVSIGDAEHFWSLVAQ